MFCVFSICETVKLLSICRKAKSRLLVLWLCQHRVNTYLWEDVPLLPLLKIKFDEFRILLIGKRDIIILAVGRGWAIEQFLYLAVGVISAVGTGFSQMVGAEDWCVGDRVVAEVRGVIGCETVMGGGDGCLGKCDSDESE